MKVLALAVVAAGLAAALGEAAVSSPATTSLSTKTSSCSKTSPVASSTTLTKKTSTSSKKSSSTKKSTTTTTKTTSSVKTTSSTKKTSSTKTTASPTPSPTQCTQDQASYGMVNTGFGDGLKGWTFKTNSTQAGAVVVIDDPSAPDGDGKSLRMQFPKGNVVSSTITQVITACAHYAEGYSFEWLLVKGDGCHMTASIPPELNWLDKDLTKRSDGDWNNELSASNDFGTPDEADGTAVNSPYSTTVTCNGTADSEVRLDYYNFGGIG